MTTNGTRITNVANIPTEPHFAILEERQVTEYTGWEKEGGCGPSTTYLTYVVYTDEEQWKAELQKIGELNLRVDPSRHTKARGIVVSRQASVQVTVSVK